MAPAGASRTTRRSEPTVSTLLQPTSKRMKRPQIGWSEARLGPASSTSSLPGASRRLGPSDHQSPPNRPCTWYGCTCLLWIVILLLVVEVEMRPRADPLAQHFILRRSVRLCSHNLSDALFILCRDRGYNEPFANSGEIEVRHTTDGGLVQECCYNACSIEQMEQYCKPLNQQQQQQHQQQQQ